MRGDFFGRAREQGQEQGAPRPDVGVVGGGEAETHPDTLLLHAFQGRIADFARRGVFGDIRECAIGEQECGRRFVPLQGAPGATEVLIAAGLVPASLALVDARE